ncbi:hypothetical protein QMO_0532 [Clostridioides difficile DA00305]|nr:hypothetical protein QMO_0532 [Clostridioides difficile DA00305]
MDEKILELLQVSKALLAICKAISMVSKALLVVCKAISMVSKALLVYARQYQWYRKHY